MCGMIKRENNTCHGLIGHRHVPGDKILRKLTTWLKRSPRQPARLEFSFFYFPRQQDASIIKYAVTTRLNYEIQAANWKRVIYRR